MSPSPPALPPLRALHIVGRSGNGKTTLIVDLIGALRSRGLRVGTVKHSKHTHELDTPGKDSFRLRMAGGTPSGIISAGMLAVFVPPVTGEAPLETVAPMFAGCDLVLIEGYIEGPGPKLEIWRRALGAVPLAVERDDITAVVSDDEIEMSVPVWSRTDLNDLADRVMTLMGLG